jgi:hypothetical protein
VDTKKIDIAAKSSGQRVMFAKESVDSYLMAIKNSRSKSEISAMKKT